MKKYLVISKEFKGFLCFAFDKLHYLKEYRNCTSGMSEEQVRELLQNLAYCLTLSMLREFAGKMGYTVVPVDVDLSFEAFYEPYGNSRNRLDALNYWEGLKPEERQYMLIMAEAMLFYCKENTWYNRPYPGTFLRERYADDWVRLIVEARKNKEVKK